MAGGATSVRFLLLLMMLWRGTLDHIHIWVVNNLDVWTGGEGSSAVPTMS